MFENLPTECFPIGTCWFVRNTTFRGDMLILTNFVLKKEIEMMCFAKVRTFCLDHFRNGTFWFFHFKMKSHFEMYLILSTFCFSKKVKIKRKCFWLSWNKIFSWVSFHGKVLNSFLFQFGMKANVWNCGYSSSSMVLAMKVTNRQSQQRCHVLTEREAWTSSEPRSIGEGGLHWSRLSHG